eukprot:scaffold15022_cov117-Isochrysis_galbana.AAC.6
MLALALRLPFGPHVPERDLVQRKCGQEQAAAGQSPDRGYLAELGTEDVLCAGGGRGGGGEGPELEWTGLH